MALRNIGTSLYFLPCVLPFPFLARNLLFPPASAFANFSEQMCSLFLRTYLMA